MIDPNQPRADVSASRRALFAGAGALGVAGVLAACGGDETPAPNGGDGDTPTTGAPQAQPGEVVAKTSDIPVGGGKVIADKGVVVTQPTAGEFRGYTSICTHNQCVLANVSEGTINCGCHFSKFAIADGKVLGGPAPRDLPAKELKVEGDDIKLA